MRETIIVVDASAAIVKGSRCSHTLQDTIRNPLREREREKREREREKRERERDREREREREREGEGIYFGQGLGSRNICDCGKIGIVCSS